MQPDNPPSVEEWKMISEHLQLVFKKETPTRVPAPGPSEIRRAQDEMRRVQDMTKKLPNLWPGVQPMVAPMPYQPFPMAPTC
ncbi:MAG: hypothetical protein BGO99_03305 [Nitrosospira sp. 56-18]|nr:MAG: hypothetical protein BGO99_03305 [Nitrosospira sp. 56-18]